MSVHHQEVNPNLGHPSATWEVVMTFTTAMTASRPMRHRSQKWRPMRSQQKNVRSSVKC